MSAPLGVAIEVDTSRVLPELDRVKGGLRDTAAEMEKLKAKVAEGLAPAAAGFAKVATAIEQERQALDRLAVIQDQQAAKNATLARGFAGVAQAIAQERDMLTAIRGPAEQFAKDTQLLESMMARGVITTEEYTAQLAKVKDALQSAQGGGSGGGGMFQGLGSQLGLGGLGGLGVAAGAVMGVRELASISDKYTDLRNSALRFVEAGHDVDQVLADQRQLSRDLHMDMGQSMQAYALVKEANDGVNLSYEDTIRLDKTLGEAAQLNDRSTQDLAQQMQNLRVALETGADASRPLRTIFKEFPALQKQWTDATGLTEKQLYSMARSGQLSYDQLARASITATDAIDAKFGEREKTWARDWDELKDTIEQPIDLDNLIKIADIGGPEIKSATDAILRQAEALRNQTGIWSDLGAKEHDYADGVIKDFEQIAAGVTALHGEIRNLTGQDPWNNDKFSYKISLPGTHTEADPNHPLNTIEVPNTIELYKAGAKSAGDFANAVGEAKLQLADLNAAMAAGAFNDNMLAYRKQWEALTTTIYGRLPAAYAELHKLHDPVDEARRDLTGLNEDLKDGKIGWKEYADEAARLYEILHKYDDIPSIVDKLGGAGSIIPPANVGEFDPEKSGEIYREQVGQNVLDNYNKTKFEEEFKALEAMGKESGNVVGETWKRALGEVNKSIVDLVITGKASFGDLASSIERMIMMLALNGIEGGIAGLFKKSPAAASDGDAAAASAAMQLGQLLFAYGGSASVGTNGLQRTPRAAYGANFMVGGIGATDSQLAQLYVSPGEMLSVSTPQQQLAQSKSSGEGGGRVVNHFNMLYDKRAIISNRDDDERVLAALRRNASAARKAAGINSRR